MKDNRERKFASIILAAGKGTRMNSPLAKVMHPIMGRPMLWYSIQCARQAGAGDIVVVVGHQAELVKETVASAGVKFADQLEQLGTGHAVLVTRPFLKGFQGTILILCGDVPLLKDETIEALKTYHATEKATLTVLTTLLKDPKGYGRIIKDAHQNILRIVEERDATPAEREVREINTGIYCVESEFLFDAIEKIGNKNAQQEYYLTDIVGIAVRQGQVAKAYIAADPDEVMGINSQEDLRRAEELLRRASVSV